MNRHEMYEIVRNDVLKAMRALKQQLPAMMFFVEQDGRKTFQYVQEFIDRDKDQLVQTMRRLVQEHNFAATVLVTEAWMSRTDKDELPFMESVRPSEDPEREEVLIFTCEDAEGLDVHILSMSADREVFEPFDEGPDEGTISTMYVWFPNNVAKNQHENHKDVMQRLLDEMRRTPPSTPGLSA
jgi:hypothetical protein